MTKYSHAIYLGCEVISSDYEGEDITKEMIQEALQRRITTMFQTDEWKEACLPPTETFKVN